MRTILSVLDILNAYAPVLTLVTVVAGAIVYAAKGGREASKDTIALLQAQVNALANQIELDKQAAATAHAANQKLIAELTGKVGELTGELKARDEYVGKLEKVLANRDPALVELLTEIRDLFSELRDDQKKNREEMALQTGILKSAHPDVAAKAAKA